MPGHLVLESRPYRFLYSHTAYPKGDVRICRVLGHGAELLVVYEAVVFSHRKYMLMQLLLQTRLTPIASWV